MLDFLEKDMSEQYLGLLSSRWAALVPAMGRRTQKMQQECSMGGLGKEGTATAKDLAENFGAASLLLDTEHTLYRRGVQRMREQLPCSPSWEQPLALFLQSMLTELCVKESILADWQLNQMSISPDTLRVYAHALLAHPEVRASDVARLVCMVRQGDGS